MGITFDEDRFDHQVRRFTRQALPEALASTAQAGASAVGARVAGQWPVDSGDSKKAWTEAAREPQAHHSPGSEGASVSNPLDYAVHVEYGTATQEGQHIVQSELRQARRPVGALAGKAVQRAWSKP